MKMWIKRIKRGSTLSQTRGGLFDKRSFICQVVLHIGGIKVTKT